MDFLTPSLTSNDRVLRLKHCHGNQQVSYQQTSPWRTVWGQFCSALWRNGVQWSSEFGGRSLFWDALSASTQKLRVL